jgi:hypothetical protein
VFIAMPNESGQKDGLSAAVEICLEEQREIALDAGREDLFGARPPARRPGRPAGARNKETERQAQAIRASGQSPLSYLASVWRDDRKSTEVRIKAATAALPYVHKKQPVAIDVAGQHVTLVITGLDGGDGGGDPGDDAVVIEGELLDMENDEESKG